MTAHTPGPWVVESYPSGHTEIAYVRMSDGRTLARFGASAENGIELGNARLIAAAPDLLAALKAVVDNHCANDKLFCSTCTPARVVIAKAEGQ